MTDRMIMAGAKRLSELGPALQDPDSALLPDFGSEYLLQTLVTCKTQEGWSDWIVTQKRPR